MYGVCMSEMSMDRVAQDKEMLGLSDCQSSGND